MNVKELSEFTGKEERTIRRWVVKAADKMSAIKDKMSASSSTHPADYSIDEVEAILNCSSLGVNAVLIVMANARDFETKEVVISGTLTQKDLDMIATLTGSIITNVINGMEKRVSSIEEVVKQRKALLPAPSISPRQNISKIVREYAHNNSVDHQTAYRELYTDFGYRTHMNVSQRAKNRGMAKMDYIEAEGLIDTLEAVAIDLMR